MGANHIEKVVRETGIAKVTGGAVGVVSGILGKRMVGHLSQLGYHSS